MANGFLKPYFCQNPSMQRFLLFIPILLLLTACTDGEKPAEEATSKHSPAFNQSVDDALNSYYALTESFVVWDSISVPARAKELELRIDSLQLGELKKDSVVSSEAVAALASAKMVLRDIHEPNDLTFKRRQLNILTQHFFDFLRAVQYDVKKVYLQECPMAFNDEEPGIWLSPADSIRNPYLGTHHPYYGKGMLHCGDNKTKIDFTPKSGAEEKSNP